MGTFRVIPKQLKDQILDRVTNQGVSVMTAAREHGVSDKTIYVWLRNSADTTPTVVANRKLKKQVDELLLLVGHLSVEVSKLKKKKSWII